MRKNSITLWSDILICQPILLLGTVLAGDDMVLQAEKPVKANLFELPELCSHVHLHVSPWSRAMRVHTFQELHSVLSLTPAL